jgi:hypothetical protein
LSCIKQTEQRGPFVVRVTCWLLHRATDEGQRRQPCLFLRAGFGLDRQHRREVAAVAGCTDGNSTRLLVRAVELEERGRIAALLLVLVLMAYRRARTTKPPKPPLRICTSKSRDSHRPTDLSPNRMVSYGADGSYPADAKSYSPDFRTAVAGTIVENGPLQGSYRLP